MKCVFDKPLRADDSVVLNLYKRVYPKWTYRELKASSLTGGVLGAENEE